MANFNKIWKNFLTEGTFQQKSADNDELYELETPENPKNDDQLLREVTEEELHHIYRAIEEMEASDLAFNELFDGKKRVVVDFPALPVTPVDTTGAGDTFTGYLLAGLDNKTQSSNENWQIPFKSHTNKNKT